MWIILTSAAAGAFLAFLALLAILRWPARAMSSERSAWAGLQCGRWPIRETCRRWRRRQAQLLRKHRVRVRK